MGKALARTVVVIAILVVAYSTGVLSTGWTIASTWVTTEWGNIRALATGEFVGATGATASGTVVGTPDNAASHTFLRTNGDGSP